MGHIKTLKIFTIAGLLQIPRTTAHIQFASPPSFRSILNPHVKEGDPIDYTLTAPLSGPAQFPCKGYAAADMSLARGASVVTYRQGAKYTLTLKGFAIHGGGSCQLAISPGESAPTRDSFRVIKSMIGNCPSYEGQSFEFKIPSDTPKGRAVFAWTWHNRVGNREIYQDCASVTIARGRSESKREAVSFNSRPRLFVANLGNGCTTVEGREVEFPDPGPVVEGVLTGVPGYVGNCGSAGPGRSAGGNTKTSGANSSHKVSPLLSQGNSVLSSMTISKIQTKYVTATRQIQSTGFAQLDTILSIFTTSAATSFSGTLDTTTTPLSPLVIFAPTTFSKVTACPAKKVSKIEYGNARTTEIEEMPTSTVTNRPLADMVTRAKDNEDPADGPVEDDAVANDVVRKKGPD